MSVIKLSLEFLIKLFCRLLVSERASECFGVSERDEGREREWEWTPGKNAISYIIHAFYMHDQTTLALCTQVNMAKSYDEEEHYTEHTA